MSSISFYSIVYSENMDNFRLAVEPCFLIGGPCSVLATQNTPSCSKMDRHQRHNHINTGASLFSPKIYLPKSRLLGAPKDSCFKVKVTNCTYTLLCTHAFPRKPCQLANSSRLLPAHYDHTRIYRPRPNLIRARISQINRPLLEAEATMLSHDSVSS